MMKQQVVVAEMGRDCPMMTSRKVIRPRQQHLFVLLVLVTLGAVSSLPSTATARMPVPMAELIAESMTTTTTTTTTTSAPANSLEDPNNSATSESSEDDALCLRCYEHVNTARSFIAIQLNLVKKQQKLIRQKHIAAVAAASSNPPPPASANPSSTVSARRQPKPPTQTTGSAPSNTQHSTNKTENTNNKPIVVSRLRVARSTDEAEFSRTLGMPRNGPKSQRDPVFKQLKKKQEQQLNETCESLHNLQRCLNNIAEECLGDLQFHSQEVYLKQWLSKMNCPSINNPGLKPFPFVTRSITSMEEREKVPIPRPFSSEEETQKKLDAVFGGKMTPFGVMLKPTLSRSASQKFNSMGQQQSFDGRRYSLSGNEIVEHGGPRQLESQLVGATTSQLLLIPCFLVLLIALVATLSRHLKHLPRV